MSQDGETPTASFWPAIDKTDEIGGKLPGYRWLVFELVVDDALEGFEGLGPRQKPAIDKECWRCVYAKSTAFFVVGPNRLAKLSRVEALVERL